MTPRLIFTGSGESTAEGPKIPEPPSWRAFGRAPSAKRPPDVAPVPPTPAADGLARLQSKDDAVWMVNAAILLRRPLLVTGPPGAGKTTLARMVAAELGLGPVLRWSITSSTQLADGLYQYDAISWVQEQNTRRADGSDAGGQIGRFIRLGPVGTALLAWERPRVLLIDEIDKADIDLPNDLLHVFEEGEFEIPELFRLDDNVRAEIDVYTSDHGLPGKDGQLRIPTRTVHDGVVRCFEFPVVVLTSNGERSFPPAFLRRCLRLHLALPDRDQLMDIVRARIPELAEDGRLNSTLDRFVQAVNRKDSVAVDQLLHVAFLISAPDRPRQDEITRIQDRLMGKLDE